MASVSRIQELCDQLRGVAISHGFDAELPPGLSDQEITEFTSWFPMALPEPLRELYRWRNGQPIPSCSDPLYFSFRGMQFASLQQAHVEYECMMSTWGTETTRAKNGIDLRTSFPFARGSDGWYVVPCDGQDIDPRHPFPIVAVSLDFGIHYYSMEAMLATCVAWERASTWTPDFGWRLPEKDEMRIWQAHNPGIFGVAV